MRSMLSQGNWRGAMTATMAVMAMSLTAWTADAQTGDPFAPSELHFAATVDGSQSAIATTPQQIVFLDRTTGTTQWTASANQPWLEVAPRSGTAPAMLTVSLRPAALPGRAGTEQGEVRLSLGSDGNQSQHAVRVTLTILDHATPPFGWLDVPPAKMVVRALPVRLVGWALDDLFVDQVDICADGAPREPSKQQCADPSKTLLGHARFAFGLRPDVRTVHPRIPFNDRAGWVFDLTSDMLPRGDNVRIFAVARDTTGQWSVLNGTATLDTTQVLAGRWSGRLLPLLVIAGAFIIFQLWIRAKWLDTTGVTARHAAVVKTDRASWLATSAVSLVVMGFAAIGYPAMTRSLNYDELVTASNFIIGTSLQSATSTMVVFNNHIAYSLLTGLAVRLFGGSEWVLRMPALVLGAATIFVVWRFARTMSSGAVALISAALLAVSPSFVLWSTSARGYTGLALMTVISSYCFLVLLHRHSARLALGHTVSSTLAVYFHLYGVWILFVQYLVFLWLLLARATKQHRDHGGASVDPVGADLLWKSFSAVAVLAVLLYLPVLNQLLDILDARGRVAVQAAFPAEVFRSFSGSDSRFIGIGLSAISILGLVRRRRIEAVYICALLGVPLLAMWLVFRPFDLYTRFFVYWTPMFAYLLASGLVALSTWAWSRRSLSLRAVALVPAVAAWVLTVSVMIHWVQQDRGVPQGGYRELLQPAIHHSGQRMFALGDAQIFDYYLGKPLTMLLARTDLETALLSPAPFQVVYHNVSWNSPEIQDMAAVMKRWCLFEDREVITLFRCGQP